MRRLDARLRYARVLEAGLWGLLAASSLLIGAALGLYLHPGRKALGLLMGFGAGTLLSALSFELTAEAFALGGPETVAGGLAAGALAYYAGDRAISKRGAAGRMSADVEPPSDAGPALLLGAVLDGIPESAVLGITVLEGGEVGLALLLAIFISNLPEALSSAASLPATASRRNTLLGWTAVVAACGLAAALGYGGLQQAEGQSVGFVQAFAGGAVLMTVAVAMLPEAHALGGRKWAGAVGLATVLGFAVAALLSSTG